MSRKKSARTYRRHQPDKTSPKKWLYLNIGVAITLIAVGVGSLFWMGQQSATSAPQPSNSLVQASRGTAAPQFLIFYPDGQEISLSDYEGQVILINWWATWCPPCKAEMPAINAFYKSHQADGFVVLAVNSQEGASTAKDFIQSNGFTFPVLLDSKGQIMDRYHVRALPTSFIIDRHGVIQHIQTGEISPKQLEAIVEPLL
jgi:cytochrome c biogenesis protein CcmG/thiol:disulfide interchange protein DsbE